MRRYLAPVLLISLLLMTLIRPDPAFAGPQDGPREGSGHTVTMPRTGRDWYGAYRMGPTTAYCADLMSAPPRRATAWTEAAVGSPLIKQAGPAGGSVLPHGNGSVATTADELADLAWVLTHTGQAPSPDTGSAVEHFVRVRTVSGAEQTAREDTRWAAVVAAHPSARAEFDTLTQGAALFAGPYTARLEWDRRPTLEDPTGRLLASVLSRSGNAVPGVALAVRVTGSMTVVSAPARTGSDVVAIDLALQLPGVDPSAGGVEVSFAGLAGPAPRVFVPAERTVQRLLVAPATRTVSAAATATLEPRFMPGVTTKTRDVVAVAGEPAIDIVTVSGGRPGAQFAGSTTLFGPFASLDELAAADSGDAPSVGAARFGGRYGDDGSAEVHSEELTFPGAGYYTWVEALEPAEFVTPPPPPAWPQLPETSLVVAPEISTELTPHGLAVSGVEASDAVRLAGVPALAVPDGSRLRVRVSGRLVGPVPPRGTDADPTCEGVDWAGAPVVARYEDLDLPPGPGGLHLAGLASARLSEPGCYSAEARVTLTHDSREPIVVEHAVGHPAQTVLIGEAPAPSPEPTARPSATPAPEPRPTPPHAVIVTVPPVHARPGLPSTGD